MRTSRGKTAGGQWIFGDIQHNADCIKIREQEKTANQIAKSFEVIPETVGDSTGLLDIDGNMIYEGDICIYYTANLMSYKGVIVWLQECACFYFRGKDIERLLRDTNFKIKVIGNIHDNPDLEDKK